MSQEINNNNCDPGICGSIPGLVYNADLDQCAWPDEVGCSLNGKSDHHIRRDEFYVSPFSPGLGYLAATCSDTSAYGLKPADFDLGKLPAGKNPGQYFLVCVPETTAEDRRARSLVPTGPVVPRLLGCPGELVFNAQSMICE